MFIRSIFAILFLVLQIPMFQTGNDKPVVYVVLFYSPTCSHCQLVIRETLLPLVEQYGEQLQVIGVDTTQPQGSTFYDAAREMFNIEFRGVPFLVIGNEYLSGSVEIPQKLPGKIEEYLSQGGVGLPDIPGLQEAISASQTAQAPTPTSIPPTSVASLPTPSPAPVSPEPDPPDNDFSIARETKMTIYERVMLDPKGNGMAIAVLILMIAVLIGAMFGFKTIHLNPKQANPQIIPILCILGLGIAGYLTYVETTQTTAVCGPIGECNTVQQSEYGRLFGVLPIGLLGVIGYLAVLFSWGMAKSQTGRIAYYARLLMFILSTIGIAFSIYLPFLEPFVIGATCDGVLHRRSS